MAEKILPPAKGTILKLAVTADLGDGIHMKDVDFVCNFFKAGITTKSVTLEKKDMIQVDKDEYLACVDTSVIGAGEYFMRFTAYLPDTDVEGGIREETVVAPTGIRVIH